MDALARADLHVHSKHSDRPSEWLLRRIGAPECVVEPMDIYRRARERGMDFVTISDHNKIGGALEIADLPGTFISSEITTYFPEDGAKLHCLVWGITEAQFERINELRESIYDFRAYLHEQSIPHAVAHPLFRVNDRLGPDHVEKLLVLFKRFELINGTRDPRAREVFDAVVRHLSADAVARMADKHGLEPFDAEPERKWLTGGSDDHSGAYIGVAHTTVPGAETVDGLLDGLRRGDHEPAGSSGSSLRLGRCFYHIGYGYYRDRLLRGSSPQHNLIDELFSKFVGQSAGSGQKGKGNRRRFFGGWGAAAWRLGATERMLVDDFRQLFGEEGSEKLPEPDANDEHERAEWATFVASCRVAHTLGLRTCQKFMDGARQGRFIDSLQTLASFGPVAMSVAPYLAAIQTQHKDERFIQAVADRFEASRHLRDRSRQKAWVTDTALERPGAARLGRALGEAAQSAGRPLTMLSCTSRPADPRARDTLHFEPVGGLELPGGEGEAAFPPFLEVIEAIERQGFHELVIATPGPMGLTALAAGKLLGLKLTGVYHNDLGGFIEAMTEDEGLANLAERFGDWFYSQMDRLYVPSEASRSQLLARGFASDQLRVMPRGVDAERFSPDNRSPELWSEVFPAGSNAREVTLLSVGRLVKDGHLESVLSAVRRLREAGHRIRLVIVGDGPDRARLAEAYAGEGVAFVGAVADEQLPAWYASADAFVFPAERDAYGHALLEAQASGLPAVVPHEGGPAEIVEHDQNGLHVEMNDPEAVTQALARLCVGATLRESMGRVAREKARACRWDRVFAAFWDEASPRSATMAASPAETA